jgi:hypothetical protein
MSETTDATATEVKERVFLESDDEIRGQKFVCLSFLTPNRGVLRNKDLFFFHKFLEFYQMDHRIRSTEGFIAEQLRTIQNSLSDLELALANAEPTEDAGAKEFLRTQVEKVSQARDTLAKKTAADMETYVKANLNDFKESAIVESYEKYMAVNRQRLEDEFHKANDFQTSVHGLKVRGVYSTHEQAVARAKALSKKDPYFNVYVADVGEWLPWDPDPDDVAESEYAVDELNKLMKSYKEQAAKKDAFFEEEKRQKLAAAAESVAAAKKKTATASETATIADVAAGADIFAGGDDLFLRRKAEAAAAADNTITHS